ncbi:MAG: GGDEF domain-containing protein [Gammaproteobacteria bacterium]|nr:GGDEF domain-containing protein [Gammaproteobacteria bacterium]
MTVNFRIARSRPIILGVTASFLTFVAIAVSVLYLGAQSQKINNDCLDSRIGELATAASLLIDGDLHEKLQADPTNTEIYSTLVKPLVDLHNLVPEIYYLYTMIDINQKIYFILDTTNSSQLKTARQLKASKVMELYEPAYDPAEWLKTVRSGRSFVDKEFFTDEFGTFVSASAPFYNSQGEYAGFVGLDFDVDYFLVYEQEILNREFIALVLGVLFSLLLGFLVWINQSTVKKLRDQQYLMSITDPLTGAFNRRYFESVCEKESQLYKRHAIPFSILVIDIDYFKHVNDEYGHPTGDAALIELVALIRSSVRVENSCVRLGGEEFALVLPNTLAYKALILAERLRLLIEETPFHAVEKPSFHFYLTVSIGVADITQGDDILSNSDKSLYRAKENGRNCVVAQGVIKYA